MRIHTPLADRVYQDRDTGVPLARTGPLQIVFCDRGTPSKKPGQFTIYQAIKDELVARGMSAEAVRFVHEARKPARTESPVRPVQSWRGVGADRAAPRRWAPARTCKSRWRRCTTSTCPGVQPIWSNARAASCGKATRTTRSTSSTTSPKSSYDTVMWQKVQAKALFIEQMRRNEVIDTEIEDLSGGDIGSPPPLKPKRSPPATPATSSRSNSTTR